MSSLSTNISLGSWLQSAPQCTGVPDEDVGSLDEFVSAGNALLALRGHKRDRSPQQAFEAASIHTACRSLRRRFLALHADWLYGVLTNNGNLRLPIQELADGAAERCPGLVPTKAQMSVERQCLQADKEGFEIDQGLLLYAFLRSRACGEHILETALQPTARSTILLEEFREKRRLDLGSVLIEKKGSAAHLTINNTNCLNAEDECLVDDLEIAVDLALLDGSITVGVLRGGIMTHPRYAGRRVFSAGINLKKLRKGEISFIGFLMRREFGFINKIIHGLLIPDGATRGSQRTELASIPGKPWVGVVDSFAIGGGAQILLALDHVIAAADSYFSLPAAKEGIIPGFANLRLSRFMGPRKSRQVVLRGQKISASDPDAGLIFDEVVDSSQIDQALSRSIGDLSSFAVVANRHVLNLAEEPPELFLQYAAEFALLQSQRLYSDDVLTKLDSR
jgi:(3,5-dihydroxyphenyl)acetyl-CoA 1,2-dioxygenase